MNKFTWGESVVPLKLDRATEINGQPGEIVGVFLVETTKQALTLGVAVGEYSYTVEFPNGATADFAENNLQLYSDG